MINLDLGLDNNSDYHCDNCGWFVNEYGKHKARLIFDSQNENIDIKWLSEDNRINSLPLNKFIDEYFEINTYKIKQTNNDDIKFIREYSKNDNLSFYSCLSINNFLRFNKYDKKVDLKKMESLIDSMNNQISKFVLKKTLITYRGMNFNKNDDFIKMLNKAINSLKINKTFTFIDNGFISTSLSLDYAKTFAKSSANNVEVLCAFINLPNSNAMPLSKEFGTTVKDYEKEVLLKSRQNYQICSIQRYTIEKKMYYRVIIINSKEGVKND